MAEKTLNQLLDEKGVPEIRSGVLRARHGDKTVAAAVAELRGMVLRKCFGKHAKDGTCVGGSESNLGCLHGWGAAPGKRPAMQTVREFLEIAGLLGLRVDAGDATKIFSDAGGAQWDGDVRAHEHWSPRAAPDVARLAAIGAAQEESADLLRPIALKVADALSAVDGSRRPDAES